MAITHFIALVTTSGVAGYFTLGTVRVDPGVFGGTGVELDVAYVQKITP